jgi:electron transfer flavoprotein alpha subunit
VAVPADARPGFTVVESVAEKGGVPDLAGAQVIVSGGRGLGSAEKFSLVHELADALGGAVGATRAVVDMGWIPYAYQIGQTGKTVRPKLYIAVGISGEIQHKVGMQTAGTVVTINKDPNAPLFQFSDFGVIGDLHQVVPALTEEIKRRKGMG